MKKKVWYKDKSSNVLPLRIKLVFIEYFVHKYYKNRTNVFFLIVHFPEFVFFLGKYTKDQTNYSKKTHLLHLTFPNVRHFNFCKV